jgi:hypothetical protein
MGTTITLYLSRTRIYDNDTYTIDPKFPFGDGPHSTLLACGRDGQPTLVLDDGPKRGLVSILTGLSMTEVGNYRVEVRNAGTNELIEVWWDGTVT